MQNSRSLKDGERAAGGVNEVERRGESVLRPMGHWSASIHQLLLYLEDKGFEYSPRFLGIEDATGRERLSYIGGEVAMRPWPEVLCSISGIEQIGTMLRRYHADVVDYQPVESSWLFPDALWSPGQIICHGDLGPWNMVWDENRLVGLIDWDFAQPGSPLEDFAQAAWHCVPLKPEDCCVEAGVEPRDQSERLKAFCRVCGITTETLFAQLQSIQKRELSRIHSLGGDGIEPWASFLRRGDLNTISRESKWLTELPW